VGYSFVKKAAALILQARLDSSRLPGKALLPLGGAPMIAQVMRTLRQIPSGLYVLAAPFDAEEAFAPLAREAGFTLFCGSKEDVLGRYAAAIRHFGLDSAEGARIIRATGDNPFVFTDAAARIAGEAEKRRADYAAYQALPYGAGVECAAAAALLRAARDAKDPFEREHVMPYLYRHGELFKLYRPEAPRAWRAPALRVTIDTADDYKHAQTLFAALEPSRVWQEKRRGTTLLRQLHASPT
jgi:spore coat polysaccharide biosynthesis protein SpsF